MLASVVVMAATTIWANWDALGPKFAAWWLQFKASFMVGFNFIMALPKQFYDVGANIMQGLVDGITGRLAAVRDSITGAADQAVSWFKEKLGIQSPSRVFMQLGGYVSEGAAAGISGGAGMVRNAALAMAAGSVVAMSPALAAPSMVGGGAGAGAGGGIGGLAVSAAGGGGSPIYNITINAAPGMDAQALAKAVSAELDRRERASAGRRQSVLGDND